MSVTTRMDLRPGLAIVMLLAAAWAGCISDEGQGEKSLPASGSSATSRPTVVALIDSGIDVYHEAYRSQDGRPRAEDHPLGDAVVVQLSQEGSHESRMNADASVWDGVRPNQLYAFAGTRVLGISVLEEGDSTILNPEGPWILDQHGHGTSTSSMVAVYDPDTLIVMIQVHAGTCPTEGRTDCRIHPSVARGMAWASEQPWIDIISVSIALIGNPPDDPDLHPEMRTYLDASRKAHASGKILLNGAGNTITPPLPDYFNGPPWIIAVGGAEIAPRGAPWQASQQVDLVANFSEWVAVANTLDQWRWTGGTSLSSPIVAATLSQALRQVRDGLHSRDEAPVNGVLASGRLNGTHVQFTSEDFRDALNHSGVQFQATDWDPTKRTTNNTYPGAPLDELTIPVVASYVQMGWGYVNSTMAGEIASRVLSGDKTIPPEKAEAALYQAEWQQARETYWRQYE